MRKVVVYELLSLDGVAERPETFLTEWDAEMDENLASVIGEQDAVILGRASHDEWADYWRTAEDQPFSGFINPVPKYVATSTPLDRGWENATAIDGGLIDFVRQLKDQSGGVIGVHASIAVAQALLTAGLVDEVKVVIAPVIVGRGRRLFDGLPGIRLELVKSVTSSTGHLLVDYRILQPTTAA